jgi:Holliday junction resolvase RusA-like endonuclease
MKSKIKDYQKLYGHIPNDFYDRVLFLMNNMKLTKKEINDLQMYIKNFINKVKWERLEFIFYMVPGSTPRPRYSRFTKRFYVKGAHTDQVFFENFIEENNINVSPITTGTRFFTDIYIPIPKTMSKLEQLFSELRLIRPLSYPDWDNTGKKYSDMISKILINDNLIIDGGVRKFYSSKPRVEIIIEYMTEFDSKFNKKKVENWLAFKNNDNVTEKNQLL